MYMLLCALKHTFLIVFNDVIKPKIIEENIRTYTILVYLCTHPTLYNVIKFFNIYSYKYMNVYV